MYQKTFRNENFPLSSNLQIVAHEFGHAIWEMAFDSRNTPKCDDRMRQEFVIKGLHDGFADMQSHRVTGSTNLIKNTLNFVTHDEHNFSIINFNYNDIIMDPLPNSVCNRNTYCIGTLFSNVLFNAQKT